MWLVCLVSALVSTSSFAGVDDDWAGLPTDGGRPLPVSAPPLLATPAGSGESSSAVDAGTAWLHPHPRWTLLSVSLGATTTTSPSTESVAVDLFVGAPFGRVGPASGDRRFVEGWFITPGFEGAVGGWSSRSVCGGIGICSTRLSAGAGVRIGWGQGVPSRSTGRARLSVGVFSQVGVLGGLQQVPSAPLAPAISWGELVVRGRLGVTGSMSQRPYEPAASALSVLLAFVVEVVPISARSKGVLLGGSIGLSY